MENSFRTPLKLYSIPIIVFKNVLDFFFFLNRISKVLAASETRKQLGILLFIVDETYSENLVSLILVLWMSSNGRHLAEAGRNGAGAACGSMFGDFETRD